MWLAKHPSKVLLISWFSVPSLNWEYVYCFGVSRSNLMGITESNMLVRPHEAVDLVLPLLFQVNFYIQPIMDDSTQYETCLPSFNEHHFGNTTVLATLTRFLSRVFDGQYLQLLDVSGIQHFLAPLFFRVVHEFPCSGDRSFANPGDGLVNGFQRRLSVIFRMRALWKVGCAKQTCHLEIMHACVLGLFQKS